MGLGGRGFIPRWGMEWLFFLRRWLASPLRVGAIAPSSPALTHSMAQAAQTAQAKAAQESMQEDIQRIKQDAQIKQDIQTKTIEQDAQTRGSTLGISATQTQQDDNQNELIVELGPGTGSVTRALLESGISEESLVLVERDEQLYTWLKEHFPKATVLHSDAKCLKEILPTQSLGKISTVVSSLPLKSLPRQERHEILKAIFCVLSERGFLIQYSYGLSSPVPYKNMNLRGQRVAFATFNLPPATVWQFTRMPKNQLIN